MSDDEAETHWERVYAEKDACQLSWHLEGPPPRSLELIASIARPRDRILDVGGGESMLGSALAARDYEVTVLDISGEALRRARRRDEANATRIEWVVGDITTPLSLGRFEVWHDRAVFHFLTHEEQRESYRAQLRAHLVGGGYAVVGTFAPEGPARCSGLPIERYDAAALARALGEGLHLVSSTRELHRTPWGAEQAFQYTLLRRL